MFRANVLQFNTRQPVLQTFNLDVLLYNKAALSGILLNHPRQFRPKAEGPTICLSVICPGHMSCHKSIFPNRVDYRNIRAKIQLTKRCMPNCLLIKKLSRYSLLKHIQSYVYTTIPPLGPSNTAIRFLIGVPGSRRRFPNLKTNHPLNH